MKLKLTSLFCACATQKMRMWVAILAGIVLVVAGGSVVAYHLVTKYRDVAYRFRLLEARQDSLARSISSGIAAYQAARGDAQIAAPAMPFVQWSELPVPWDPDRYQKTKAIGVFRGELVAGLRGESAALYSYDGNMWRDLTDRAWSSLDYVHAVAEHKGLLYAAINSEVWAYDPEEARWFRIVGPWIKGEAYCLRIHDGSLYLGITADKPRVFRLEGKQWIEASRGLPVDRFDGVYELWDHTDGYLYASLTATRGSTRVYRLEGDTWRQVGGDGVNGSWTSAGFLYGLSFASHKGLLIVSMTRHPMARGKYSSVWAYDGTEWRPVGAAAAPANWAKMHNFNAVASIANVLFVGGGGHPAGNASVWAWSGGRWHLAGGHGLNGSWGKAFPYTLTGNFRNTAAEYVYRFIEWNGSLIAGFGDADGAGRLWKMDPTQ